MNIVNSVGEDENKPKKMKEKNVGGIRTMPFILANDICDRFASTGFHANMITYLTQELNMPLVKASNTLTNFGGTANFTPLIGALIADSYAGRFLTIAVSTIIYELGLVSITISAVVPSLQPPACPTGENCVGASMKQLWVLYAALLLTAVGTGGMRPCVVTFAADQLDMSRSGVAARGWGFFNVYYFSMGLATLTALTFVVYVQDNVGWGWGLGIPTIAMLVSIAAFLVGSPLYRKVKPGGSPLVRLAQVVVAAMRKRGLEMPTHSDGLYENRELDADLCINGRLLHSDEFKCLDKAAIMTPNDTNEDQKTINLWRVATVHRVEELKCIIRMLPIWSAGILSVTAHSHQHSFVILQARAMDRHVSPSSSFQIPPASLSIFSTLTLLLGLALYDRLFVPIARRITKNPSGITCLQLMGVGLALNLPATIVAALVENKRRRRGAAAPLSVFWLIPQFCLHGVAEVFSSVGHLEFLYDQSPESMRSTAAALFWLAISVGQYLGTLLVTLVHDHTAWLPDRDLDKGRLDYYYYLVSGILAVNLIYYAVCAWFYTYKPVEEVKYDDRELVLVEPNVEEGVKKL